ncbi:MAG: hypothetical protein ACLS6Z_11815 [Roseburia inulinivorans]
MRTQIQMGCDEKKCRVIENGINYERLSQIPLKEEDGQVDIGQWSEWHRLKISRQ